jgi:hypothetical protein
LRHRDPVEPARFSRCPITTRIASSGENCRLFRF